MGCDEQKVENKELIEGIKTKEQYFDVVLDQIKRIKGILETYSTLLNCSEKKKKSEENADNFKDLKSGTAVDSRYVSYNHQLFYIMYCNTFIRLKSVLEDVYFFENNNREYKEINKEITNNKSDKFSQNYKKSQNEFMYFYMFDLEKANNYLKDLLDCEKKFDQDELKELESMMGTSIFSKRPEPLPKPTADA